MDTTADPVFKPYEITFRSIDDLIHAFASVLVGRQMFRASLLAAIVAPVLAPLFTHLFLRSMGIDSDPLSISVSILIPTMGLALAIFLYARVYRGSRKLLALLASTVVWRILMFSLYLFFFVPAVMLWYIPDEPLLLLYVAALTFSIVTMISFARWSRKCYVDLADAYRRFSTEIFYSPLGGKTFSFMVREVFSLPPGYLVSKGHIVKILLLSVTALALEGLSVSYILQQTQNVNYAMRFHILRMATLTAKTAESRVEVIGSAALTAFFPLVSIPILVLGGRIRRTARRAAVTSVLQVRTNDQRTPLLFLRSFTDDQVVLSPTTTDSIFHRALVHGSAFPNIDEMLTERYWHVGPVFAIGKPSDSLPPLGAAREYIRGEDWQTVVDNLMKDARVIILTLDETQGVLWELQHVRELGLFRKCLLLLPPHRRGDIKLLKAALAVMGVDDGLCDNVDAEAAVGLLPVSSRQCVVLCAKRTDSHTYDLVMRLGMQVILRGDPSSVGLLVGAIDESGQSEEQGSRQHD